LVDQANVAVIGNGVIGMTTALSLSAAGYKPVVISKDRYFETTSAVAAAFWYPYKAEPREKSAGWAQRSLSVYKELTGDPPLASSGVNLSNTSCLTMSCRGGTRRLKDSAATMN